MKKIALTTLAFLGLADLSLAADLPMKAPAPVAPVTNWTGCYVGAGFGYGMYNDDSFLFTNPATTPPGFVRASTDLNQGGRGWIGTVQGGCDYQFHTGWSWLGDVVIGAFVDGDWTNISGDHTGDTPGVVGLDAVDKLTINSQWALGGRAGVLVTPSLLTYVSGGYIQANMSGATYRSFDPFNTPTGDFINSQTYNGWFLGTGDEYSLGRVLPGLFWKTEYRFAQFNAKNVTVFSPTLAPNGFLEHSAYTEQNIRSTLTYRFNWGAPMIANY
jgi:outer membrane immunogenic protein